jgi:Rieske Fe-S protein
MSRRTVLRGAAVGGVVVAGGSVLSACGGGTTAADSATGAASPSTAAPSPGESGPTFGSNSGGGGADVLTTTSDVPVDGGVVLAAQKVVITQPKAKDFKCFSAVCTHLGCLVNDVSGGTINCPCHGSQYSIEDGSVVSGPAPSPLPAVAIKVEGHDIVKT